MVIISATLLALTNLIPLIGVLSLGWSIQIIITGYFTEAFILGIYNIFKLLLVQGKSKERQLKNLMRTKTLPNRYSVINKFILTYAIFLSINTAFFIIAGLLETSITKIAPLIVAYIFSHGISFVVNFLSKKEYRDISLYEQFTMPFKRIAITQFPIWMMAALGVDIWILGRELDITHAPITNFFTIIFTSMIIYKTILDLGLHIREHKNQIG